MFAKFLIKNSSTLREALNAINAIGNGDSLTLFVIDGNNAVVGTLTDGDIRRSLINGATLEQRIDTIAYKSFRFLRNDDTDVFKLRTAKAEGIELLPILNEKKQIVDIVDLKKQKSYLPIDAILMAGGKGERLRPLTEKIPKPLLKVGDKAIIDHNVERLLLYGIKDITVIVNHLGEQLEEHFENPYKGVQVKTIREPEFLGTVGGVQYIEDFAHDTVLIMNADLFTDIDFEAFYLHFVEHHADICAAAVPYSVSVPFGIFELEGEKITGIKEKPSYNYFINAGMYLVKKEILNAIPKHQCYDATNLIVDCTNSGKKVVHFPIIGFWYDMGTKEDFLSVSNLIESRK